MTEFPMDDIRDPKRLRALTHPLRWQLIDLLDAEDTATATRCAEALGESVASCSYHLNMLAKYGFVEEAPGGQGREKPWRLRPGGMRLIGDQSDTEGRFAAEAATESLLAHTFDAIRAAERRRHREPEDWRKATGLGVWSLPLTAEETARLREQIDDLVKPYVARAVDPSSRPEGARQVRLFNFTFVNAERTGQN